MNQAVRCLSVDYCISIVVCSIAITDVSTIPWRLITPVLTSLSFSLLKGSKFARPVNVDFCYRIYLGFMGIRLGK